MYANTFSFSRHAPALLDSFFIVSITFLTKDTRPNSILEIVLMKVGQNYNIIYHKLTFDPGAAVVLLLDYLCIFMRGTGFLSEGAHTGISQNSGEEFISDLSV